MADYYSRIEYKTASIPVGLNTGGERVGEVGYVCAAEVSRFGSVPKELLQFTLAPATYAVFAHEGHVTLLRQTYIAIWNEWLSASGRTPTEGPSFERHNPSFDTRTGEGGLTIWIPIEQD
jgi:AraC family transcriptional regulator